MAQWTSTSATSRLLAVSVSLVVTAGLFLALTLRSVLVERPGKFQRTIVFLVSPRPMQILPRPAAGVSAQAKRAVGPPREAPVGRAHAAPQPAEHVAPVSEAPVLQAAEPADSGASAPLRTDPQTLHRAIAGAQGNIQRLARSSGVELDTRRPTQSEQLSSAIAETGVPDCLAPNAGGSLLSIPIIAYMAVKGKCK